MSAWGRVSAQRDICLGVCMPGEVGLVGCLSRGVSARGCVYPSMQWGRHPPAVNRMTDRCKSITFPQLRLRAINDSLAVGLLYSAQPGMVSGYHTDRGLPNPFVYYIVSVSIVSFLVFFFWLGVCLDFVIFDCGCR